jgi:hypothetical protein
MSTTIMNIPVITLRWDGAMVRFVDFVHRKVYPNY